jgi:hypothetical protein
MNELLKTKLFSLLAETSQVTNQEMENAYDCFMKKVETINRSEKDYSKIYRILSNTRIELVSIETLYRYGQGEKCP